MNTRTIRCNDGISLKVPTIVLEKYPQLSPQVDGWGTGTSLNFSGEVGHVVVHYLFTGTYQCLQPRGNDPQEKHISELTEGFKVYITARDYKLTGLEELAKGEIKRLEAGLFAHQILAAMQNACPVFTTDHPWLCDYLKSRVRSAFSDPMKELAALDSTKEINLTTIFIRAVIESHCEAISTVENSDPCSNNNQPDGPASISSLTEPAPSPLSEGTMNNDEITLEEVESEQANGSVPSTTRELTPDSGADP